MYTDQLDDDIERLEERVRTLSDAYAALDHRVASGAGMYVWSASALEQAQCTRDVGGELGTRAAAAWVIERVLADA